MKIRRKRIGLRRHKISDREPCKRCHAAKEWMANPQKADRRLARGSLHRLVRRFGVLRDDHLLIIDNHPSSVTLSKLHKMATPLTRKYHDERLVWGVAPHAQMIPARVRWR